MKFTLLIALCLFCSGCQFASTLFTGARKITTVIMDDRSFQDDLKDFQIAMSLREDFIEIDPKLGLDISPDVFEGKVLLTGALPNIELIQQILEKTWNTPDVKMVYNYIRIDEPPSLDIVNTDAAVSAAIRTQLTFTRHVSSSNYKLIMENGTLYVMGIAKNEAELERVISVIKNTAGVSKIVNLTRFKKNKLYTFITDVFHQDVNDVCVPNEKIQSYPQMGVL
ncbi:MAG: BON domain-containing protein [Alphaproteobacteria bacterium]|nr:BON domain-containing protein [Alphaproteobacteria bacterium]